MWSEPGSCLQKCVSAALPLRLLSQETLLTKHPFSDRPLAVEKFRGFQSIKSYRIEYPPTWCRAFFSITGFRFPYLQKFLHILVPNDSWFTSFISQWFISYPWTFPFSHLKSYPGTSPGLLPCQPVWKDRVRNEYASSFIFTYKKLLRTHWVSLVHHQMDLSFTD